MNRVIYFALLVSLILACATHFLPAQQTLADADWFEREIGDGIIWRYYLFDNLYGKKQSVSYIKINLANPNVSVKFPYLANSRQLTSSMIPSQFPNAIAGINGTYFNTSAGGHVTYLRINGTEIPPGGALFSPWGYEGAIALDTSDNTSIIPKPSGGWSKNTTHPDIMACGPLLIINGAIPYDNFNTIGSHCTGRHPRSAVGVSSDNYLILLTVDGRTELADGMTCEELARVMDELGCFNALNLDGGGSTTLWGKGEPYNGVLNFPSDNSTYDHQGERACSNAIAVQSIAPKPKTWDARLISKSYKTSMECGEKQTVVFTYQNIGTAGWSDSETSFVLARPESRTSPFYDGATWLSISQPARMMPQTAAPGETAVFAFTLQAPDVPVTAIFDEHFMLKQSGIGRIGPADSEAWMRIVVQSELIGGQTFIVESRVGGKNYGWYSDSGMADSAAHCTAPDCTGNIGSRYGSTYRSVAGLKNSTAAPSFPEHGYYKVYVAWSDGSLRKNAITYHVNHAKGKNTYIIDQTSAANTWVQLGTEAYYFHKGTSGSVVMTNENIDVSGSMYMGAVKFEYQIPVEPQKNYTVNYLGAYESKPVIDGVVGAGEWDKAEAAASGFVQHDNPAIPAAEDGSFKMLYDDEYLYILFQVNNSYLPGYAVPPENYGYADLNGDKINFFISPFGTSTEPFYRILFCPNISDSKCYVWSQASLIKTLDPAVGIDWTADRESGFTYNNGLLTIEYRIPFARFNYSGINVAWCPQDNEVWGIQPAISNQISAGVWEYVNWEPDNTPSYVMGVPFGGLTFREKTSGVSRWEIY